MKGLVSVVGYTRPTKAYPTTDTQPQEATMNQESEERQFNVVSIDIETTGLDTDEDQVLEIGIVLDNSAVEVGRSQLENYMHTLPVFRAYVYHDRVSGNPYAMKLNANILGTIAKAQDTIEDLGEAEIDGVQVYSKERVTYAIYKFLYDENIVLLNERHKYTVAGKNAAGFDLPFLRKLPRSLGVIDKASHKVLDPGSLYFNPRTDIEVPSLDECLQRAGYSHEVNHTAVEDAKDVLRVLRHKWYGEG